MEESQASYLKAQEELKVVRAKNEADARTRDNFLHNLLERSS